MFNPTTNKREILEAFKAFHRKSSNTSRAGKMKKLNRNKFISKVQSAIKAPIQNLNNAYDIYRFIYNNEDLPVQTYPIADRFKTPDCPNCGKGRLQIKGLPPKGPGNLYGYKTLWYCNIGDCTYESYSNSSLKDNLSKLKLSEIEEEYSRTKVIDRVRAIFIQTGITSDLTEALKIYQDLIAKNRSLCNEVPVTVTLNTKMKVPECPECGTLLQQLRLPPKGRNNLYGYKTYRYCRSCGYEQFDRGDE